MKTKVTIDGKELIGTYSGFTARIYREQFKSDLFKELKDLNARIIACYSAAKEVGAPVDDNAVFLDIAIEGATPEVIEKITWALLYTTAKREKRSFPLYEDWLDSIDNYSGMLIFGMVAIQAMIGNVPIERQEQAEETDEKKSL